MGSFQLAPPFNPDHVVGVLLVLHQNAIVTVLGAVVVRAGIETVVAVAPLSVFAAPIFIAQELLELVGLYTYIEADNAAVPALT